MILINSGAYVIPELQVEYGRIPPCMLPLGNRRLIEHQVQAIREAFAEEAIMLSLPESYVLSIDDHILFSNLKISIVAVPDAFTLAESVLYVLNTRESSSDSKIRLIHGDTLIHKLPLSLDTIGISSTSDDYAWELESTDGSSERIWCGYFSFSSFQLLIQSLTLGRGDFVSAIKKYASKSVVKMQEVDSWLDLGHVNTYFKSRALITTQRSFNSLSVSNGVVRKTGLPSKKIKAEANWYRMIPPAIRRFTPQLIESGQDEGGNYYYSIEYLSLSPLNEIFVHGRNPTFFWKRIFDLQLRVLSELRASGHGWGFDNSMIEIDSKMLYEEKTLRRLDEFSASSSFDINKSLSYEGVEVGSLMTMIDACINDVSRLKVVPAILHGDLCFSNSLYDSRSNAIKLVDPRGLNEAGELSIFGDQKYDLAKLTHSVIGLYDYIIAGKYTLQWSPDNNITIDFRMDERLLAIQKIFFEVEFIPGISVKEIMPVVVLLFTSMLPLHADRPDRQKAMIANALRIYVKYCTQKEK